MEKDIEEKIVDSIKNSIEEIKQSLIEDNQEGVVIFKFKANDPEINLITNRNRMLNALCELSNYRRELYKYGGGYNEIIVNKCTKVLTDEELKNMNREEIKNNESYIKTQSVIDKLDDIIGDLWRLIDEY